MLSVLLECDFLMFVYISLLDGLRERSKRKILGGRDLTSFYLLSYVAITIVESLS